MPLVCRQFWPPGGAQHSSCLLPALLSAVLINFKVTNQTSPYLEILFFHVYSLYKQCNPKPGAPPYSRCDGKGGSPSLSLVIKTFLLKKKKDIYQPAQKLKRLPGMRETRVRSLGWEDPLEKEMATHSSTLAWRVPWRKESGRLQSMGSQRVGHD